MKPGTSVALLVLNGCVGAFVAAGGYQFGRRFLASESGEWAGLMIALGVLFAAISIGQREARREGYRQGHYDGRNGLFDRTDELR